MHPKPWLTEKTIIGGTKDLKVDKINALKPDLIIGNKEENIKAQIDALSADHKYISEIETIEQAFEMIVEIGKLTNTRSKAETLITELKEQFNQLKKSAITKRVAYFIWKEPYMLAGKNTFIGHMLESCGFTNAAPNSEERYPTVDENAINALKADVLMLSSEPYAFSTANLHQMASAYPGKNYKIVDGELFSWYGPRMKHAFKYFSTLQREMSLL